MTGIIATIPQFQFNGADGLALSGGTLTTYLAGTTTLETTYQDQALTIANTNPIVLDSAGGCTIWLNDAKRYKFVLKNSAGVTQWTQDNINGATSLDQITASSGASLVGYLPAGSGALATTVQGKLRERVSVFDFMTSAQQADATSRTASIDASTSFATAVAALTVLGGGSLFVPEGSYLLNGVTGADGIKNGILLPFSAGLDDGATAKSIDLIGNSREVKFLAGSNNMIVVRCSTSYSELASFQVFANGFTGVTGIGLMPENTTTPALTSQQSFNHVHDVYTSKCAEGIVLQCGGNGGAYYNKIGPAHFHGGSLSGTRGVYLKSGVGTGTPSNANRNQFDSVRVGYANTGFEIESGDTNTFTGCSVEGILYGTLPNATPTGVKVANTDTNARGNENNRFFGFSAESCTRDAEILNPRTSFFGFKLDATKVVLAATFPNYGTMLGPYDFTVFPEIYSGIVNYGSQLPSGIGSYESGLNYNFTEVFDKGYKFKTYTALLAGITGTDSIDANIYSGYTKFGGMVDFHCRFAFNPTGATAIIKIPLPVQAQVALYTTFGTLAPMRFPVAITSGSTETIVQGRVNYTGGTAGTFLEINALGASLWNDSAGNNNRIDLQMRYRAA